MTSTSPREFVLVRNEDLEAVGTQRGGALVDERAFVRREERTGEVDLQDADATELQPETAHDGCFSCRLLPHFLSRRHSRTLAHARPYPEASNVRRVQVWLEDWEWQCCGEPFAVGAEVEWGLVPVSSESRSYLLDPLGAEVVAGITHYQTHHEGEDDERQLTRGRVESIVAAYWQVAPRRNQQIRACTTQLREPG